MEPEAKWRRLVARLASKTEPWRRLNVVLDWRAWEPQLLRFGGVFWCGSAGWWTCVPDGEQKTGSVKRSSLAGLRLDGKGWLARLARLARLAVGRQSALAMDVVPENRLVFGA